VQNYFALVFFRGERTRDRVPLTRWFWLCVVEVLFGQELLESFVTTAANSGCPEYPDQAREYGEPNQLNLHIPSGFVTNRFRNQLIQLLYYKFYLQYQLVLPVAEPLVNEQANTIDVSRVRFRLRKSLLYLAIPFRRVYLVAALGINLVVDALAFAVTTNFSIAVIVGITLELVRRILKL
jgi:hypothetical protein